MSNVYKDIFRAVHEGKWLSIEYRNKNEEVTKYWIGIKNIIDPVQKVLLVDGLHLSKYTLQTFPIHVDSILSSTVLTGSYSEINTTLLHDIERNPQKYQAFFHHKANLKILRYLSYCNRLDTSPYITEYSLIKKIDSDTFSAGAFRLNGTQFEAIVDSFQYDATKNTARISVKELGLNILSINSKKGLYVLAYKRLYLDVVNRILKPSDDITICKEFTINGQKNSIKQFLDAEDYRLLDDIDENLEQIKDKITQRNPHVSGVDDMPYIIAIGRDLILDLDHEYSGITNMYDTDTVTFPIKAFFGSLTKRSVRKKEYPLALINKKVNLDQLLAIHNAIKYPLSYVQGPPGTGKTNTIINTISTAFFNERTVLFASHNNHPIDGVFDMLKTMKYKDNVISFPIIRIGNNPKMCEALEYIKSIYERTKDITVYESTLDKDKINKTERAKELSLLLKRHEEILDLKERKETIEKLLSSNRHLTFQIKLQQIQLNEVNKRLAEIGEVTDDDALSLLDNDEDSFKKYLYYTSAKYIKRLKDPQNRKLLDIVFHEDENEKVALFNKYLNDEENLKKFMRIFPIIITTCISAHKLGEPKPYFDMVILDEASQCNVAISIVPIVRGKSLMLVGDPQQLNPVILLDPKDNLKLKKDYSISNEYDYIENSIYKTYLASDSVSDEILLSYHYRCNKKIIDFNNKKYYNNKLKIRSNSQFQNPLVFTDILDNKTDVHNTSPKEAEEIIRIAYKNTDKEIGVITPFVNQKVLIENLIKEHNLSNVSCGTVHAFQGDEKDVVLFSLAITDQTRNTTYDWLKNNKELINVATSRAKEQLIVLSSGKNLERLHSNNSDDDLYELVEYIKTNGKSDVTGKSAASRALGVKPYSSETEEAFLINLNHALDNVLYNNTKCVIHKEVGIAHVFKDNIPYNDLFYSGRFDFVVYEKTYDKKELPIFAIELDGKEHVDNEIVKERDRKKNEICRTHGFELIRIENSYARRYNYVKDILIRFFSDS